MAKNSNGANLGFETQLWAAADKMRGHMDAGEYKHVVLGLIFLKYISDSFQARYDELAAKQEKASEALLREFANRVHAFFGKIADNSRESFVLAGLRDCLLTGLLSGAIPVPLPYSPITFTSTLFFRLPSNSP